MCFFNYEKIKSQNMISDNNHEKSTKTMLKA